MNTNRLNVVRGGFWTFLSRNRLFGFLTVVGVLCFFSFIAGVSILGSCFNEQISAFVFASATPPIWVMTLFGIMLVAMSTVWFWCLKYFLKLSALIENHPGLDAELSLNSWLPEPRSWLSPSKYALMDGTLRGDNGSWLVTFYPPQWSLSRIDIQECRLSVVNYLDPSLKNPTIVETYYGDLFVRKAIPAEETSQRLQR